MDKKSKNKENYYFNTLSNIPMFEQGQITNRNFYKTTYNEEYQKKNRYIDNPSLFKESDFSIQHSYDFKQLSDKLEDKNNENSKNRLINNNLDQSVSSFYKTPRIPSYIKRDNHFQTNSQRNIGYLHTHTGGLLPIVPSIAEKRDILNERRSYENFFADKLSISQTSFTAKEPVVSNAKIMSHLREDNMFHTNKGHNIKFLKTSNGSIVSYVPMKDSETEKSGEFFNLLSARVYDENNKAKLNNPNSQLKRNSSTIRKYF